MGDPNLAIRVERLSKRYLIGHESTEPREHRTLRDAITRGARMAARTAAIMARGGQVLQGDEVEEFWALKNLNFDVARGEVVGIIGRNGAGKSTLLKVLSRITEPTEGRVEIRGRVSSLLEVGTGFHPELTGRENIFLNGAILGMSRAEVRGKFDEIVAFAEIDRFLDTPVKRYSSGMYVRLAFSVAAHLEPEILIVDEVLAVGDVEFQRKCLGKMQNVAGEGRTVLFVSHNLQAVERLCTRAMLLHQGCIVRSGAVGPTCAAYLAGNSTWRDGDRLAAFDRRGTGEARITDVEVLDASGRTVAQLPAGESFRIRIYYQALRPVRSPTFGLALLTAAGGRILNTVSADSGVEIARLEGTGYADIEIRGLTLAQGHYMGHLSICDSYGGYCDYLTEGPLFDVIESEALPRSRTYDQSSGAIYAKAEWTLR
jgi:lipopolysaccharide transport system ATP-binding protein